MSVQVKAVSTVSSVACDNLILPFYADGKFSKFTKEIEQSSSKTISRAKEAESFSGAIGQVTIVTAPQGIKAKRVVLWGLGEKSELNNTKFSKASATLAKVLQKNIHATTAVVWDIALTKSLEQFCTRKLASLLVRARYNYTTTKNHTLSKDKKATAKLLFLRKNDAPSINKSAAQGRHLGDGINLARELGNLPGNICTPKHLSSVARQIARKHDKVRSKILGEKQLKELDMHSMLSVGTGSVQESQLIILEYKGGKQSEAPVVLVGKGITFDTGGISLKPGAKMDEMKFDMCGAAAAMGSFQAAVSMKLPINLTMVIAAAENMPAGNATKPGDVVRSMSGKTIEILNTDAEGRLVLCDALTYVKRFKPKAVVDMATLTGACIVALGHHTSGVMSNDDQLANDLITAGVEAGDRAWQLPLYDEYHQQLKSNFADIANIGGPSAGTITAGCFLSQFAEDYPWAHIDIAGTAWNQAGEGKGASGRPVSLVIQYLLNQI